ncbi:MAG TPA: NADPH-dependent FMN reductase [Thermoanaerobaculia bacterium]|jgi:NAD(P)H-dependent FMN reductase|nr:NADPH-dependent FMN reductase [Thermoanaerobaculia bacterium]
MKIIAICGSLRAQSSNLALLRAATNLGIDVQIYEGLGSLPHFNPDDDGEGATPPPAVAELRKLLAESGGILISSPEYAHGVPGSLKNMLDWLVSDGALVDKPVALINASPVGGEFARDSLVETLTTMNWRVTGTWSSPKKVRDENVDDAVVAVIREALESLVSEVG